MTRTLSLALAAVLSGLAALPASAAAPVQRTWHADQARVPDAREPGRGGAGVLVAVLDTWVDRSHPDFEGRVREGADCTSGSCRPGATRDACTHGTHVAGTVASSSYGVATKAEVLPVQVLRQDGDDCTGTDAGVAAGIRWAVGQGARVLNLSLGTLVPGLSSSRVIVDAVAEAHRAGAVVVFAAGNSSVPVTDTYGGQALIVAATGPDGSLARYSQRGDDVSLAAPGGNPPLLGSCAPETCVTSLYPDGGYAVAAGTSMAAPHVAGTAALLLAQDPSRTREAVVDRLLRTARDVPGGGAGAGLLDAAAALSGAPAPRPTRTSRSSAPSTTSPAAAAPSAASQPAPAPVPTGSGAVAAVPAPLEQPGAEAPAGPAEQPPEVAAEPSPVDPTTALDAEPAAELPTGPPALAAALVLTAALSTALAGLRRR